MALLDFFLSRKKSTANIAKERLQIIVAERRRSDADRIIYRSYVKIFLRSFVNTYKSIRKWLPSSLSKKMVISPSLNLT